MEIVLTADLAKWLDYSRDTIFDFVMRGRMGGSAVEGVLRHTAQEVKDFLAQFMPSGGAQPLSYDDFRQHGMRLIRPTSAGDMLGIAPDALRWQAQQGGLRAYQLNTHWRFVEADIESIIAYRKQSVTQQQLETVLGVGRSVIRRLRESGRIEALVVAEAHFAELSLLQHRYTRDSLVATVRYLLAPHAAAYAETWVATVLESHTPPLTTSETMQTLGIAHKPELFQLADTHRIPYLGLGGAGKGDKRFHAAGIRTLFTAQPPLDVDEVAAQLGWEPDEVAGWLTCDLHDHSDGVEHRRACLVAGLASYLSEGLSPAQFLMARTRAKNRLLVPVETAAQKFNAPTEDVVFAAEIGILPAIRRPDGVWLLLPTAVKTHSEQDFALAVALQRTRRKNK